MATLPATLTTSNQFMALETCLHAVILGGFDGLATVKDAVIDELSRLLESRITILQDEPRFVLIIHNHRQKLAILGQIQAQANAQFEITLDGHVINSGSELMDIIYAVL